MKYKNGKNIFIQVHTPFRRQGLFWVKIACIEVRALDIKWKSRVGFRLGGQGRGTVRLLTHVLCKPTHFFFLSFIATMSYSLQTRYDMTYIYDRYYIRTHVYMFLFSVKKRVFELLRV